MYLWRHDILMKKFFPEKVWVVLVISEKNQNDIPNTFSFSFEHPHRGGQSDRVIFHFGWIFIFWRISEGWTYYVNFETEDKKFRIFFVKIKTCHTGCLFSYLNSFYIPWYLSSTPTPPTDLQSHFENRKKKTFLGGYKKISKEILIFLPSKISFCKWKEKISNFFFKFETCHAWFLSSHLGHVYTLSNISRYPICTID